MRRPWRQLALAGVLATGLLAAGRARAVPEAPLRVQLSAGVFDLGVDHPSRGQVGVELISMRRKIPLLPWRWRLHPIAGLSYHGDGGFWLYAGLRHEVRLAHGWRLAPSLAAAYYQRGHGRTLGLGLEFRSALELSVPLGSIWRVGLSLQHLSNARLSKENPGQESLVLTFTVPGRP